MSRNDNIDCPFCQTSTGHQLILEIEDVIAIYDRFPVSPGHALVIPRRHCANYFELTQTEKDNCWKVVNEVKKILDVEFSPDGYNVGINVGHAAGQTIPHVHIHLIPRYHGDLPDPEGGVRGVIPAKRKYGSI